MFSSLVSNDNQVKISFYNAVQIITAYFLPYDGEYKRSLEFCWCSALVMRIHVFVPWCLLFKLNERYLIIRPF